MEVDIKTLVNLILFTTGYIAALLIVYTVMYHAVPLDQVTLSPSPLFHYESQ